MGQRMNQMKRFKDWKIAIKLYAVLGVMIVMLLSLGLFGLYQADAINQRVNNLYTQEVMPMETVEDMKSSLYRVRDRIGRFLSEPERISVHERKIEEQLNRLERNEQKFKESRLGEEETRLIGEYQRAWDRYLDLINNKFIPLSRDENIEAAEDVLYGPALQEFRQAREAINNLTNYQVERAKRRHTNAGIAYEEMFNLTLVMIIGGLILASLLGLFLVRNITKPIYAMREVLEKLDQGDLTHLVDYESCDEIGEMASVLNRSIKTQRQLISSVATTVDQVAAAGEEMSAITIETSKIVEEQRSQTEQVATAMNEMTATVREVALNITNTASAANDANEQTVEGSHVVQKTIDEINNLAQQVEDSSRTINEVEKHSEAINSVLDVIKGVAEQTNLLALNAAIEAARAGEQGRGFAVVADEVRTLAGRTQQSTEEINEMIDKLQNGSKAAVKMMNQSREQAKLAVKYASQSGVALETISKAVGEINQMSTQIASAAEEQGSVSEEINRNIVAINDMSKQTAEGARETSTASQDLARMAANLQEQVGKFRI